MSFRSRVLIGAALLLTSVCTSSALALTAEPMSAERSRELFLARAVDAWVAGDLVACERWLDQISAVERGEIAARAEALRAASAGMRGEGGRVSRLVGEENYGRGTVEGPARGDSSMGRSQRFALRRLGASSVDRRDWLGAECAYVQSDSLRTAAAAVLHFARTDAGADSLWRLWSGAHAGALSDPNVRWIDSRDLLGQLVARAESASRLRDSFNPREATPPRREVDGVVHPLLSEAPAPSPTDVARVTAAGDSLAIAAHGWSEAAADLEELEAARARLARYLALGRGRLADERANAATLAARLDSLCAQALAAAEQLESQRAGAAERLAQRVRRLRARASDHTVAYDAMEHFYLEGPAWPDPAPMGYATPNAVLDADRALAAELARQAEGAGLRAEALTRENFVDQFGPRIEARRAAILRRLEGQDGAIAALSGQLDGQLDGHPAERALADACTAARAELGRRAEQFAARREHLHALRVALASDWADQVAARLAAESEVDAYGRLAAAYGGAHDEATPEARSIARARLERFLQEFPESMARGESRYRLAELVLADGRARLHLDGTLPDLSVALGLYDDLLRDDSTYAHRDAVLHQAGLLRLDSGNPAMASEGAAQLTRLLAEHPGSAFTQSAQLRLGVAHFEQAALAPGEFDRAATLFEAAANGPDRSMGAIALYELGWLRINQDRLLAAADSFRRLIDRYEDGLDAEVRFDLRQEAERDLVSCLAKSGGATAFRQVFTPHGPKPSDERILVQLADLLREHALFAESAETEALRMELAPLSPSALDAGARRIDCLDLGYRRVEAEQARLASVDQFGPGSAWDSAQSADSVRARGSRFARSQLAEVARARHADARAALAVLDSTTTPDLALWRASNALHERLLRSWGSDRDAPRWHFLAAEARAHEAAYGEARAHFHAAAQSDTARFALQAAWQEAAITDTWYEATRGGREHGDDARADDLLESIARFRHRAPDDPRSVDLLWRAGQVAWAHADLGAALESFREMASRHESDPRAPEAAELCAEILTRMDRRPEAAAALEDLARRWPARPGADRALYRAALVHRDESRPVDALRVLRRLNSAHSKSELSRDAWLLTAQVAETASEPRASAEAYRTLAERFPHDADAPAALLRAADLYEDAEDTGEADRMRLSYLDARPDDEETALAILEPFARRELSAGGATATSTSKLARYLALAERHPALAANDLVAEVDFERGAAAAAECDRIPLSQPLAASLEKRRAALEVALACFRLSAEHGVPEWTHAANVRTGELLVSLGEALEASERPRELSDEDRAAYDQVLGEQAWDLYDQGERVWSDLLTRTRDQQDDPGDWLARARAELWPRVASRFVHRPEVEFPVVLPVLPEVSR